MTAHEKPKRARSVRERLLDAADELFHAEGVQSVGIDRVIEHAGVAKMSLYRTFGSKEDLVAAYLARRHESIRDQILQAIGEQSEPRARLLAVFDTQARWLRRPTYRGCSFTRASAEPSAGEKVHHETDLYRADIHAILTHLAAEAGSPDPDRLGTQLFLLYHGASITAKTEHLSVILTALRAAVESLVDISLSERHTP